MKVFSKSPWLFACQFVFHGGAARGRHSNLHYTGSLRGLGTIANGPLPNLIRARREEASKVKDLAHLDDDLRQSRLAADLLAFFSHLGFGIESCQALFERDR
jgi:hypothetical protein